MIVCDVASRSAETQLRVIILLVILRGGRRNGGWMGSDTLARQRNKLALGIDVVPVVHWQIFRAENTRQDRVAREDDESTG